MDFRKNIRLKNYDYTQEGAYYITICVHDNKCLFGKIKNEKMNLNVQGEMVQNEWLKTQVIRSNVILDEFVIMPNHFHGILVIVDDLGKATRRVAPTSKTLLPNSVGSIIGQFKSAVTKKIRTSGIPDFKWQRNYYDRVIRDEKELNAVRKYIFYNPNKWEWDKLNPIK
jgi:putative transposase